MSSTANAHRLFAVRPGSRMLVDATIAAAAVAGSLTQLRHGGIAPARSGAGDLDLFGVLLAACSTLPLIAWRRFPLGVFVVTAAASVLLAGLGYPVDLILGPTAALFVLAASRDRENPWTRWMTATVAGLLVAYLGAAAAAQAAFPAVELLHTGLAWAVAWFAGERTRLRREQMAEFKNRAVRAEREAERERQLAVAEERARIARDLHDSAGHAISVIAVRAGAARLRHHRDPDRSLRALQAIEDLARQTVEELDETVSSLRDNSGAANGVEPPHGIASLAMLIAHQTAAGLEVALDTTGDPTPLGRATDQATYRILQEALTNAARHGTGSATIVLAFGDVALDLTVTNPTHTNGIPRPRGGHGLIGMRERAALLGGNLDVRPANGAFRVHAHLPYGPHQGGHSA